METAYDHDTVSTFKALEEIVTRWFLSGGLRGIRLLVCRWITFSVLKNTVLEESQMQRGWSHITALRRESGISRFSGIMDPLEVAGGSDALSRICLQSLFWWGDSCVWIAFWLFPQIIAFCKNKTKQKTFEYVCDWWFIKKFWLLNGLIYDLLVLHSLFATVFISAFGMIWSTHAVKLDHIFISC